MIVWNNALINALSLKAFEEACADTAWWGRLVENAVGAHLLNGLPSVRWTISYWRDGDQEMDFVVTSGSRRFGVEVKSGPTQVARGIPAFRKRYPDGDILMIGGNGLALEEFLLEPASHWFR